MGFSLIMSRHPRNFPGIPERRLRGTVPTYVKCACSGWQSSNVKRSGLAILLIVGVFVAGSVIAAVIPSSAPLTIELTQIHAAIPTGAQLGPGWDSAQVRATFRYPLTGGADSACTNVWSAYAGTLGLSISAATVSKSMVISERIGPSVSRSISEMHKVLTRPTTSCGNADVTAKGIYETNTYLNGTLLFGRYTLAPPLDLAGVVANAESRAGKETELDYVIVRNGVFAILQIVGTAPVSEMLGALRHAASDL